MPIERHRRTLADGSEKVYTYGVSGDRTKRREASPLLRRSLSIRSSSSVSVAAYRSRKKNRIVAALLANSSLLVIGEPGSGKTFLANTVIEELQDRGFTVATPRIGTVKQILMDIANDLGVDTETLEGKTMTVQQLRDAIAEWLEENTAFLVLDDVHRFPASMRYWLEQLHIQEQPMLLLATYPPARDIFLRTKRRTDGRPTAAHRWKPNAGKADSTGGILGTGRLRPRPYSVDRRHTSINWGIDGLHDL